MTSLRAYLQHLLTLAILLAIFSPSRAATNSADENASAGKATRPNVVIFLVDDMGWSDIGCYGSEIPTPNIDALAATGVRFTQFYNTARCSPTRAAIMTGLYPHQAGMG